MSMNVIDIYFFILYDKSIKACLGGNTYSWKEVTNIVAKDVPLWCSITNLGKLFDIGRTKTTELVQQMATYDEYKDKIISFSHKKKTVNVEAFQDFLIKKVNNKWLS